ncbi:doublecortin domain-containing protein 2B isoform X2 [Denticeps clupeoides]|uniref:Doublecortin domain-containing protein n=1 Tax=Denticeps clupeoides TaxID=299321 RepID=A0AAY4A837_9TELE|nr:doublecortin domain-containing protein 2B-like isoform X2 [Denticeps clupeoides]
MASGSSSGAAVLPPVKSVVVYRNGDPFHAGRRFVVNQRQVLNMEAFLNDVTLSIQAPLAVRTLYTPRQGHRVHHLQDLQTGSHYVAAGYERFKKLDYLNAGVKKPPGVQAERPQVKAVVRPGVEARWRKMVPLPCIIRVFRNGDALGAPLRFIIPRHTQQDLEQVLSLVTEKAALRTGAVRRLCTMDGVAVTTAEELQTGRCYVAVGTERFKKLPYLKATSNSADRQSPGYKGLTNKYETRRAGPQDTHSDSALLTTPEMDSRRVKSTGDDGGDWGQGPTAPQRPGRRVRQEKSIFYAKPVRVQRNQNTARPAPRAAAALPSVFEANGGRRRDELRGAQEVLEDEDTIVELPVDERTAETVEEEEHSGGDHKNQMNVSVKREGASPGGSSYRGPGGTAAPDLEEEAEDAINEDLTERNHLRAEHSDLRQTETKENGEGLEGDDLLTERGNRTVLSPELIHGDAGTPTQEETLNVSGRDHSFG